MDFERLLELAASYEAKYTAIKYENERLHDLIKSLTGVDFRVASSNPGLSVLRNENEFNQRNVNTVEKENITG